MLTDDPTLTFQMSLEVEPTSAPAKVPEVTQDWRTQVPTVTQLTRNLRGHIENTFFDVWVKGEISNFKKPVSGHAYFNLKDANAQLRAVMFRQAISKVKFQVKDGVEVLLHGKLSVYEARGDYQIICDAMEPVGMGALQLAFEQLKAKLQAEGLFNPERKKRLPILPKRIGIVTSATGAAIRDVLKVISTRFPERRIFVLPASVQGDKAAPEIVNAISLAQRWNQENPSDRIEVLIVGRGGGSIEDLWPFNEEIVARAIAACTIPTISAVGHEVDFTIADFVADVRAPTPSAAAEMVLPAKRDLLFKVQSYSQRNRMLMLKRVEQNKIHLTHLSQRLVDPRQRLAEMRKNLKQTQQRLKMALVNQVKLKRARWERAISNLNALSPLAVLSRGYSITSDANGEILTQSNQVKSGDLLTTRLHNGQVHSVVQ